MKRPAIGTVLISALFFCCPGCGDDHGGGRAIPTLAASSIPSPTSTPSPPATPDPRDPLSGGETTVFNATTNAFGQPARNLPLERRTDFFVGNALFNRNWVTAPASTDGSDGLGPVFNARSCSACHFHDGRGRPPADAGEPMVSLLIRLSVPGIDDDGGPLPDPTYGGQLGPRAILGVPPEGRAVVSYEETAGTFGDGDPYALRNPRYDLLDLAFGAPHPDLALSPRVAPFLIGLGLLSAIDEETILALADDDDADGDGVSGRPNRVWNRRLGETVLGRFGWKANQPTLEQQNAGAFLGDIGITSALFPDPDCPAPQVECRNAPSGGEPEVDDLKLDRITFYTHLLAVPARRDVDDPGVRRGERLFTSIGCAACHVATLTTGELEGYPELSRQTIHPYTDLLLHDMGEGLADHRPDHAADGFEWRTAPLWGIGLVETVNQHSFFLHDGRARDLTEAILWHGGEGEESRELFRSLAASDREALIRFMESL
ncbi:MAG TPA: di-heme oxidoredictase family protein [Candidatus Binatia bacterium]|nr:di-heme oxidoredictase family protein [Candidatus Binatia bacterium]